MQASLTNATDIERHAELYRVLGHENRLRLILLLARGEQAVGALEAMSGIGQPGLSQQLAILRKAGLVATRRAAKQIYYRIDAAALQSAAALLDGLGHTSKAAPPARPKAGGPKAPGSAAGFARMV
jgi:DNA-binding transcriptional ArsR family regulator